MPWASMHSQITIAARRNLVIFCFKYLILSVIIQRNFIFHFSKNNINNMLQKAKLNSCLVIANREKKLSKMHFEMSFLCLLNYWLLKDIKTNGDGKKKKKGNRNYDKYICFKSLCSRFKLLSISLFLRNILPSFSDNQNALHFGVPNN